MKTVIFDMDGTLLNSAQAITESVNATRRHFFGLVPLETKRIIDIINNPQSDAIFELYGKKDAIKKEEYEFFEVEIMKNYEKYATLYDDIKELLQNCKNEKYFIALASNAPTQALKQILSNCGILEFFDVIVGSDENTPQKPEPFMLFKVLNLSPFKKAIFLGDTKRDEEAAENAKFIIENHNALDAKILKNSEKFIPLNDLKNSEIGYLQVTWGFGDESEKFPNAKTANQAFEIIKKF